ncbi:hypothetical protein CYMTET_27144 [Cymbomonas tetramitiformis]|uniref:Uncharacterized protein n=1 Tax=Cymbomonas tetramitiformis TaxID=36881 RepID=A0AAE0FQC0_9CHLO|nr:hypothetical protein CYMTET_27144 [Cymbomonas tetramitiformis]
MKRSRPDDTARGSGHVVGTFGKEKERGEAPGGRLREADEAAGLKDEAAGLKDEAAGLKDEAAGLKDEAAGLKDEAAGLKDEAARREDEGCLAGQNDSPRSNAEEASPPVKRAQGPPPQTQGGRGLVLERRFNREGTSTSTSGDDSGRESRGGRLEVLLRFKLERGGRRRGAPVCLLMPHREDHPAGVFSWARRGVSEVTRVRKAGTSVFVVSAFKRSTSAAEARKRISAEDAVSGSAEAPKRISAEDAVGGRQGLSGIGDAHLSKQGVQSGRVGSAAGGQQRGDARPRQGAPASFHGLALTGAPITHNSSSERVALVEMQAAFSAFVQNGEISRRLSGDGPLLVTKDAKGKRGLALHATIAGTFRELAARAGSNPRRHSGRFFRRADATSAAQLEAAGGLNQAHGE